jgi:hypothetical protein
MEVRMHERRKRVFGGIVAVAVVMITVAAAAAAASTGGDAAVPHVDDDVWTQARTIHSAADVAHAPAAVRALVTAPTLEIVRVRRAVSKTGAYVTPAGARSPKGCFDVSLTKTRVNALGETLTYARTVVRNWCNDGTSITSQPTVQRQQSARLGWTVCGWNNDYSGWLLGHVRFGTGGDALFGVGSCAKPSPELRIDIHLGGDGVFHWAQ